MCTVAYWPEITVHLTLTEARRIGDLNIDLDEIEIIRWRRKVRDAVHQYDNTKKEQAATTRVYAWDYLGSTKE